MIGEDSNLRKFVKLARFLGKVEKTIFKNADYRGIGVTSSLTGKQRAILEEAMRWGYYQYPRKIDTVESAQRVSVSRTTLVQHLRKAENRVMEKVMVK